MARHALPNGLCVNALTLSAVNLPTPAAAPATSRLRDSAGVHSSSSDEESSLSSILEACVEIEIPSAASSISTQAGTSFLESVSMRASLFSTSGASFLISGAGFLGLKKVVSRLCPLATLGGATFLDSVVMGASTCVEINQCVGARHRAGVASMAWRTTRTRRKI